MAEPSNPDLLDIVASTSRRVRNLETGVHPTGAELKYYDTYPPTAFDLLPPLAVVDFANRPTWQRRVGIARLAGVSGSSSWSVFGAEEKIADLPAAARPLMDMYFLVVLLSSTGPFHTQMRVAANGGIYLYKPAGATGTFTVSFGGPNWPVN